jgi:hypothetical protein
MKLVGIDARIQPGPSLCLSIKADLVNRGRNGVRDEAKKSAIAVPASTEIEKASQGRHRNIGGKAAIKMENLEL